VLRRLRLVGGYPPELRRDFLASASALPPLLLLVTAQWNGIATIILLTL
jgi:hypothetical protein